MRLVKEGDFYSGGTIYVDRAPFIIFIFNKVSLCAGEKLVGKKTFERFHCNYGINFKHIHGDNGVFTPREFKEHCVSVAHHYNDVTE